MDDVIGAASDELGARVEFLRSVGTELMQHSDRGLLSHLIGTRGLLEQWGARPALCDAGLFHSVYGTEVYQLTTIPMTMRSRVQEVIGPEAEAVAWLFCVMKRETLKDNLGREADLGVTNHLTGERCAITPEQFADLTNLMFANTLEVVRRLSVTNKNHREAVRDLIPFGDAALPAARQALDAFLRTVTLDPPRRWWQFWK
jgi:hypothetical protein